MKKIEVDGLQIDLSEYKLQGSFLEASMVSHLPHDDYCLYGPIVDDMQEAMDWIIGHQLEQHGTR